MPLTPFQREVLAVIAANRSPESPFMGGAVINRDGPRISQDLNIEHYAEAAVADAFGVDRAALEKAGFRVDTDAISRPDTGFARAKVSRDGGAVLLDWVRDSAFRFFPAVPDPDFGWRLSDADLAVNKTLALAGRREARDYLDIVHLHRTGYPLAALAWAAPAKDPGHTPFSVIEWIARHSFYNAPEMRAAVTSVEAIDPVAIKRVYLAAVAEARDLLPELSNAHPGDVGKLCLNRDGRVALPDLAEIAAGRQTFHPPSRGGAWPKAAAALPDR